VTFPPGENATCTITNDDIGPTLTVTKIVVNDDGGTAVVGDFTLRIDGGAVTSGAANAASVGAHVVSETGGPSNYGATIGGDCDAAGNITLSLGQNASCTITNDDVDPSLIWYFHNNPSPPVADTIRQAGLPMDGTAPAAVTLFNYDLPGGGEHGDGQPGRHLHDAAAAEGQADLDLYQNWLSPALSAPRSINGSVTVSIWSGIKDFDDDERGTVTAYLRHFDGVGYTSICQGEATDPDWQGASGTWVMHPIIFACGPYTVPIGDQIEVKIVVGGSIDADDHMWFAYDTVTYQSFIKLP
jgi:hypothetical protein